jgi:predicted acyl esterase
MPVLEMTKSILFILDKHNTKVEQSFGPFGIVPVCSIDTLMRYCPRLILFVFLYFRTQQSGAAVPSMYAFRTENVWLSMSDGVRLSATLAIPIPQHHDEKFPVLLEYKPYRKDDSFYYFNQPNIDYLARRGFIVSKQMAQTLDVCASFL